MTDPQVAIQLHEIATAIGKLVTPLTWIAAIYFLKRL